MASILKVLVNGQWVGIDAVKGDVGETGNGISDVTSSKSGKVTTVTLTMDDGSDYSFNVSDGEDGASTWDSISDKPSTFPPSSHDHDDRYYTETETDNAISNHHDSTKYDASNPNGYITSSYHDTTKMDVLGGEFTGEVTAYYENTANEKVMNIGVFQNGSSVSPESIMSIWFRRE